MMSDYSMSKQGNKTEDISLSKLLDTFLAESKEARVIDERIGEQRAIKSSVKAKVKAKVKSEDIHEFNRKTVYRNLSVIREQKKVLQHDRAGQLYDAGLLPSDNTLSHHIAHFA